MKKTPDSTPAVDNKFKTVSTTAKNPTSSTDHLRAMRKIIKNHFHISHINVIFKNIFEFFFLLAWYSDKVQEILSVSSKSVCEDKQETRVHHDDRGKTLFKNYKKVYR
jgi:hypothetical protein